MVRALDSWFEGSRFESPQNQQENFHLQGQLSVLTHFSLFHRLVAAVVRKVSRSFCQKCSGRLQLNTHVPYLCGFEWNDTKLSHGCVVYTELALRQQQFHMAPAIQQPNSAVSTPLQWILSSMLSKGCSHSFRITCDMSTVSVSESVWEQRTAPYKSNQIN